MSYSYSKTEVLTVLMLYNTHDVVDFDTRLNMTQHIHEIQNKYDSHTNTVIINRRLLIPCYSCLFLSPGFVTIGTTKTINFDE